MHERIAVHAFEGRGGVARRIRRHAEQPGALDDQERAKALASAEHGVAHGGAEAAALFRPAFTK